MVVLLGSALLVVGLAGCGGSSNGSGSGSSPSTSLPGY